MINDLLSTSTSPLLEKAAIFAERRQEVLAGNIANIDTPDYLMRDLPVSDFKAAMSSAIERLKRGSVSGPTGTSSYANDPSPNASIPGYPNAHYYANSSDPLGLLSPSTPGSPTQPVIPDAGVDLASYFPKELFEADIAKSEDVLFKDGNNRSIEHQMMEMGKNSTVQRFAVELLNAQFRSLDAVISERA